MRWFVVGDGTDSSHTKDRLCTDSAGVCLIQCCTLEYTKVKQTFVYCNVQHCMLSCDYQYEYQYVICENLLAQHCTLECTIQYVGCRDVQDSTAQALIDMFVTGQESVVHEDHHRLTRRHRLHYRTSPFHSTCYRDLTSMRLPFHQHPDPNLSPIHTSPTHPAYLPSHTQYHRHMTVQLLHSSHIQLQHRS